MESLNAVVAIESEEVPGECENVKPESIVHELAENAIHIDGLDIVGKISKTRLSYGSQIRVSRQRIIVVVNPIPCNPSDRYRL